jgi:hypothetical protein
MPETQEVIIISEKLREELTSRVRRTLGTETHKLYAIQSELRSASRMKTRTVGWKREEEDARKRVELYTAFLTILETGSYTPPAKSSLPGFVLRDVKSGLLEMGRSFVKEAYQRVVSLPAEVKDIWVTYQKGVTIRMRPRSCCWMFGDTDV